MEIFNTYFKELKEHPLSKVTEHTYRSVLEKLLNELNSDKKIKIQHEPKRKEKVAPDYQVTKTELIIGYVENKKIGEDLEKILKSPQIKKYKSLSDNILITNYLDWIWIKGNNVPQYASLCDIAELKKKKSILNEEKSESVEKLVKGFFSQPPKKIADAKKLAEELATRAKLLKDFLQKELERQHKEQKEGKLYQLYEAFRTHVFHELTISEYSDAFAQNLVYGLFLARLNANKKTINLYDAESFISPSFKLIKELVGFLKELRNPEYTGAKWIIEEVLTIINGMDLNAIHESLSFKGRRKDKDGLFIKDPYVYFYEDFLAAYDSDLRESKGVYFTPPPVVNFIVRAINDILKDTFKIKDGLADKNKVTVLDFATGTGTFLLEILQQIFEKLPKNSARKELLIKEHILKNLYGFEFLIAPYTLAHLKLSQYLEDNGYKLKSKERFQIYLTNTLERIDKQETIPFLPALTEESEKAQKVKEQRILVITGNPPYSGHSKNTGDWIRDLIKSTYFYVDGKPLDEKNSKWLHDDYVKFIRFAQDKIDQYGEGIVGVITNHSFIDNPTFRGMRQSLMTTFDQIYIIDLHGSKKRIESNPEVGRDENVFDIEQGVAISFFVKRKGLNRQIKIADFWGMRKNKYRRLLEENIKNDFWETIEPSFPFYLFKKENKELKETYYQNKNLKEIFPVNVLGFQTHRDDFAVTINKKTIEKRLTELLDENVSDKELRDKYNLKANRDWDLASSRDKLTKEKSPKSYITKCGYRPFDKRYTHFGYFLMDYPRRELIDNIFGKENICLLSSRQQGFLGYRHVFVSNIIPESCLVSNRSKEGNQVFPLYIYDRNNKRNENFSKEFLNEINHLYKSIPKAEDILGYIYSVLHSPAYREKYAEFLQIDFPRIPFTKDKKIFKKLTNLGNELIQVHLLEKETDYPYGDFIGKGDYIVKKPVYKEEKKKGKLYINDTQYFDNIPREVYEFYIGGYQVLDKYLKDRKGRKLGLDEVDNVAKTARALAFTIDQMKKIDKFTKDWI